MKILNLVGFMMMSFAAVQAGAATRIKLDSVAPEYRPTAGVGMQEYVSMERYAFEVNKTTNRARIVVDYTYPDQVAFGFEGGAGPEPSIMQMAALKYDPASKSVVYDDGGSRTVCATVSEHHGLFGGESVTPTGACVVTAKRVEHEFDNGWRIQHSESLDTYFEVR